MKCRKCGGERTQEQCNLCELFSTGIAYAGVEKERHNNPKACKALKVHPSQVKEAIDDARKKGVPTNFTKEGLPEFDNRRHQAKYLKAYGYFNRDGGYHD
jgi:hypothetical protein